MMKLYTHPMSTTCRPVMLFMADHAIAAEQVVVDILAGEQAQPWFLALNPNGFVPVLQDDDFVLTESSAILKYLADKVGSPAYPRELRARARVNEMMDWCNTGLYRSFGYGLCYAQVLDAYKLADPTGQAQALAAAKQSAERFLGILNDRILGERTYLCGDTLTIADDLASGILSLGEVIGCTFAAWPNVQRWYAAMRARPNWDATNGALQGWADFARGPAYISV